MMALPRLPGVGTLWSVKDHVVTIGKGSFYLAAKVGKFLAQISEKRFQPHGSIGGAGIVLDIART